MEFKCGLCKLSKSLGEKKGIILLETIIDMTNGQICNLCYFRLINIFRSYRLSDKQQSQLEDWGVIVK